MLPGVDTVDFTKTLCRWAGTERLFQNSNRNRDDTLVDSCVTEAEVNAHSVNLLSSRTVSSRKIYSTRG